MKHLSLASAPKVPANIDGHKMHSSAELEVIHLCLNSGQVVPQHSNSFDVIVCLIKGEVSLNQGSTDTILGLYDVAEIEKGLERGFTNTGNTEARLLIIKKLV